MHWTSNRTLDHGDTFADLPTTVGKAGTTDSVAIISAIWFVVRVIAK